MTERIFSADGAGKYRRVLEHVSLVSPHPGPLPQGEGKLITVQLALADCWLRLRVQEGSWGCPEARSY